ncbi:hypothetical protein PVAND_013773 [Polypedilum vanderplanki]|uniref:Uncharacterized protein n=1 Tax=Polypedilum vanderplanki TaxID=319348 RepID=A0A9J6CSK9_POLVA|nr:hypothetical protein PVAND_013773 [Polypedilum vanderplanki]
MKFQLFLLLALSLLMLAYADSGENANHTAKVIYGIAGFLLFIGLVVCLLRFCCGYGCPCCPANNHGQPNMIIVK